ncbi:MAG TPA: sulfur carrier protein ThiS [Jatrophihabitantaceae bacterium]|jgi:sulfur carrier protein
MRIELNGAPTELADDTTLVGLIEDRLGGTRGAAVVVDGSVVPRSAWPQFRVADGQRVELITAVQGG